LGGRIWGNPVRAAHGFPGRGGTGPGQLSRGAGGGEKNPWGVGCNPTAPRGDREGQKRKKKKKKPIKTDKKTTTNKNRIKQEGALEGFLIHIWGGDKGGGGGQLELQKPFLPNKKKQLGTVTIVHKTKNKRKKGGNTGVVPGFLFFIYGKKKQLAGQNENFFSFV